jgi:tRNA A-37 threonylcarbamoyl transferase component Bud32
MLKTLVRICSRHSFNRMKMNLNAAQTMSTINEVRQQRSVEFLQRGVEFSFGEHADCPMSPVALASIDRRHALVKKTLNSGLTATVYKVAIGERAFALKRVREACKVQNLDGKTSFLNELQRHAELRVLRESGVQLPGVIAPLYGSLRHGFVISNWIEGERVMRWDARRIRQVLELGARLIEHGFFEWDFCPGNLLDDGQVVWMFDFGYMYRFDPLTQINNAGNGLNCPQFHLAERIEARNLFAYLLEIERDRGEAAALDLFRLQKEIASETYEQLRDRLARKGASRFVLSFYGDLIARWHSALNGDLQTLYLHDAWRAHSADLADDLRGTTCTNGTLLRAQWLIARARTHHAQLCAIGALNQEDRALSAQALTGRYAAQYEQASRYLVAVGAADESPGNALARS